MLQYTKLSQDAGELRRATPGSAGYDIPAAEDKMIPARSKALIKTDIAVAVPHGYYGRIAPRSGLAWKHSLDVGAGVIDEDYRGPVGVILFNHSDTDYEVKKGDFIAQLILEKISTEDAQLVYFLPPPLDPKAHAGWGSTGR